MFVEVNHFHPCLIFVGTAGSLTLGWRHREPNPGRLSEILDQRGSDDSDKQSSLLLYGNNYSRKKVYSTGLWGWKDLQGIKSIWAISLFDEEDEFYNINTYAQCYKNLRP